MLNLKCLNKLCYKLKCKQRPNKSGYVLVLMFFEAGNFSHKEIKSIMQYGGEYIKELNY